MRLAVWLLSQCRQQSFFVLLATVCSSWVHINSGTSRRSLLLPEGRDELQYVALANGMASRIGFSWENSRKCWSFHIPNPKTAYPIHTYDTSWFLYIYIRSKRINGTCWENWTYIKPAQSKNHLYIYIYHIYIYI